MVVYQYVLASDDAAGTTQKKLSKTNASAIAYACAIHTPSPFSLVCLCHHCVHGPLATSPRDCVQAQRAYGGRFHGHHYQAGVIAPRRNQAQVVGTGGTAVGPFAEAAWKMRWWSHGQAGARLIQSNASDGERGSPPASSPASGKVPPSSSISAILILILLPGSFSLLLFFCEHQQQLYT